MFKKSSICLILGSIAISASAQDYAMRMVRDHGREWSKEKGWDYVSGLVTKSILKYCAEYPNSEIADEAYSWCHDYADMALNEDGSFVNFKKGSLDNIASGKVLLDLYSHEEAVAEGKGKKYFEAAQYLYDYLCFEYPRIALDEANDCFIHKTSYPYQMWLDGLYMGAAFYAEYHGMFYPDDQEGWDDIALQFRTIHSHTHDTEYDLNYHAWTANPDDPNSFWAKRTDPFKGCSSEFWGRGMGWYTAALVDVLEFMPRDNARYDEIASILQDVVKGIVRWQDEESGVWYQLLRYDDSYVSVMGNHNYFEASASCMFTYGLLKGIRLGLLPADEYMPVAEKAYSGLLKEFIVERRNGAVDIKNICRSAGLGPASNPLRDGSADYYLDGPDVNIVSNEGKGIGSFIFASLEYERHLASMPLIYVDGDSSEHFYDISGMEVRAPLAPGLYIHKTQSATKKILVK